MSTGRKRLLAYVIMVFSVMISVKLVKDIIRLSHVDERIVEAEQELLVAKQEQIKLEQDLEEVKSGEQWEKQIRDTLKMARFNEQIVIIPEEINEVSRASGVVEESEEEELSNLEEWVQVFGIINL